MVKGDVLKILRQVPRGNGAEGWRRLCWEYEPNSDNRMITVLRELMRRQFGVDANSDLALEVETCKADVRK